jgi:hypothetical protein
MHCPSRNFATLAIALLLAACSAPAPPPAETVAAQASEAQANKELAIYRQLQQEKSWELAAPIGEGIVSRFPGSLAAREVGETLADTTAKASAIASRRRLERLWSYQSGKESGGNQSTASIYSDDAVESRRVRLVLRRHSDWGESVYLYDGGKGFTCRGTCRVTAHFDDQVRQLKAYLPPTGEPALFIEGEKDFVDRLQRAQELRLEVTGKDGQRRTLHFEVGGFAPARWKPPARA